MRTTSLAEIKAKRGMAAARQERIDAIKGAMLLEQDLHALRERRGMTQTSAGGRLRAGTIFDDEVVDLIDEAKPG